MVTETAKRPLSEAQRAALAKGRAARKAKKQALVMQIQYEADAPEAWSSTDHGGYWLYLCDPTRRKHPIWVPVETDPAKNTLMLERTDYDKGFHGELLPRPSFPEAYWVADVHDDSQLRAAEAGGHVYDAAHYTTERTR